MVMDKARHNYALQREGDPPNTPFKVPMVMTCSCENMHVMLDGNIPTNSRI